MAKSPFRNFDLEALSTREVISKPIAGSHAVTDLLRRAAVACCGGRISNKAIDGILEHVTLHDAPLVPRRVSFTDFYSDYPAHLELEGVTAQQHNAARALLLLDETLDMINAGGWGVNAADRLVLAGAWISDATEKSADDEKWKAIIKGEREAAHQKSLRSRDVQPANDARHAARRGVKKKHWSSTRTVRRGRREKSPHMRSPSDSRSRSGRRRTGSRHGASKAGLIHKIPLRHAGRNSSL